MLFKYKYFISALLENIYYYKYSFVFVFKFKYIFYPKPVVIVGGN